ncbi:J domain-containing protein [Gordonibacter sp. Marseille-P4307]|uniref:J domain-containing protein n=1 Tax=Gordonibacter sp. Marseille-P4307 TaxID=2161815 RepID=UPI0013DE1718|nr:DnaJ domain-containing protein [Gordonibacter sp. Marseille-P4307]
MSKTPYEVLGVSPSASPDDIKKAYRKKARENHPDLNPGDEGAAARMNEINEAYDRLTNPERYAREDARRRAQEAYARGGSSAAAQQAGPYGNPFAGGSAYAPGGNGWGPRTYQGQNGWVYTTFTWEDIFGDYTYAGNGPHDVHPEASAADSAAMRSAIDDINAENYVRAKATLDGIPPKERTARWLYLASLANYGAGHTVLAYEQIRRAVQNDPGNGDYRRVLASFQTAGRAYEQEARTRGFDLGTTGCLQCCCGLIALNLCIGSCSRFGAFSSLNGCQ